MKLLATANLVALAIASLSPASAQLAGQYGILDVTANGGINPNTGVAWAEGDQYRLAFHTAGKINATSDDPAVYDDFATAQDNLSTLGSGAIQTSTGWTAMVYVNTDDTMDQGVSPVSSPVVRSGTEEQTSTDIGGAGVPVYAMDGSSCIARNNADIDDDITEALDENPADDTQITVTLTLTGGNQDLNKLFFRVEEQ